MLNISLNNKLTKKVISKLISMSIHRKFGYYIETNLNKIDIRDDGDLTLKIELDAKISKEDFEKIMNKSLKEWES